MKRFQLIGCLCLSTFSFSTAASPQADIEIGAGIYRGPIQIKTAAGRVIFDLPAGVEWTVTVNGP
jgi:hypothetical protein